MKKEKIAALLRAARAEAAKGAPFGLYRTLLVVSDALSEEYTKAFNVLDAAFMRWKGDKIVYTEKMTPDEKCAVFDLAIASVST